jgi:hypothetical protein
VADLGLLGVDLGVEVDVDGVCDLLRGGGAFEAKRSLLEIELQVGFGDVGGDNGEVNVVLLGVAAGRALRPGNCRLLVHVRLWSLWLCSSSGPLVDEQRAWFLVLHTTRSFCGSL